jgi:iron complex transport system substrate-binding protein
VACPVAFLALAHRPSSEFWKVGMIVLGREGREGREGSDAAPSRRSRLARPSRLSRPSRLTLLFLIACRAAPQQDARISVVDDAGDTVGLAAPARRVVSLIPATTELLFAVGAESAVVGRTKYCDYPPAARAVPDLGDGIKPNIEAVLGSRPDLVVLYNSGQNAGVAGRLRELGIPALRVNTDELSSVPRLARMLGKLTGHERAADSLAAVYDTALASATQAAAGRRPKVLLLVWEQPPMTIGRGSFLNELLERAGGENLFADVAGTDGVVSIEAVAARNPDLVFTTSEGPVSFASRPEWQVVPAVRERRFLRVTGSEFNRPSPRSPLAIRELTAKLNGVKR